MLCAGKGKRLRPYTYQYQKTMIPVHGKPLLEYILNGLIYAGFNEFVFVVGYRKEQIIEYFQDGKQFQVYIQYVVQENLNGTGGALLLCESLIVESHLFLTWGDILVPYEIYKKIHEIHVSENEDFVLVANYLEKIYKGCEIHVDEGYCVNMVEKPAVGENTTNLNNSGIFIFSREIFDVLRLILPSQRGEIELPDAICKGIKEKNWKVRILKMEKGEFRGDFGDLKEYERLKLNSNWLRTLE